MHTAGPPQQQQEERGEGRGVEERIDDDTGVCGGGELEVTTGSSSSSCSYSVVEGLASISTIESSSTRRRDRRGVTGELNGSFLSTAELPQEVIEELLEVDDEEEEERSYDEEGGREEGTRRQGQDEKGLNQWRARGGKSSSGGGDKAWVAGRIGAKTDLAGRAGREKIQEIREGGGEEEGLRTTPSTPISGTGTTATERWRSTHQRLSPQDQPTPSGQASGQGQQYGRGGDPHGDDRDRLVHEVPAASGREQGLDKDVMFSLPPAAAEASAAAAQQPTAVNPRRAPCHDGLIRSRGGGSGGSSPVGETAAATTTGPETRSPERVVSRRGRRRHDGVVDNVSGATSTAAAAKRAAAAEALNGLRMRGRIPPVRRGAGAGVGAAAAPAVTGGGRGRTGGRTSPSLLSVASVASSSVGEQYGSSFEEDTEGSSSCSVAGGGGSGSGGWGSESPAPPPVAVASVSRRRTKTKGCSAGGGGERNADCAVMTPGSVGTEITATPSSAGVLSTTQEGRQYSAGGAGVGVGEGLDKAGGILTSAGSLASAGSGSGSSGAANSANHSGGNEFAATALSFRKAAGCYSSTTSDRVSASSWTLSAGISSLGGSQEVVNVNGGYGVRGGSGSGSSSRIPREEGQTVAAGAVRGRAPPSHVKVAASRTPTGGNSPLESGAGMGNGTEEEEDKAATCSPTADGGRRWNNEERREASSPPPLQPPPPPPSRASAVRGGAIAVSHGCDEGHGDVPEGWRGEGPGSGRGASAPRGGARATRVTSAENDVDERDGGRSPARRGVRELLLHTSDAQVTPIVASRSVDSTGGASLSLSSAATQNRSNRRHRPCSRVDQLPFEPLLPENVSALHPPQLEAHLTLAYNALTEGPGPVRQKGQTLLYLQSLAPIPRVANLLVNSTFLALLLR